MSLNSGKMPKWYYIRYIICHAKMIWYKIYHKPIWYYIKHIIPSIPEWIYSCLSSRKYLASLTRESKKLSMSAGIAASELLSKPAKWQQVGASLCNNCLLLSHKWPIYWTDIPSCQLSRISEDKPVLILTNIAFKGRKKSLHSSAE